MAYNPFINEDICNSYFDCEQAVLLRFCLSGVTTIRIITSQQVKFEKVTAPSIVKSDI